MNVKKEDVEKNVVMLEIEVEAEKFESAMQKSYVKNVKQFNITGFRKGKAPRNMITRQYGEGVFYEDAINFICSDTYGDAVKESGIDPVSQPDVDVKQIGSGKNFIYTAKVTVNPEVILGKYKGVKVKKIEVDITDADIDAEIKKESEKNARIITIEDREDVRADDTAILDFEGFVDGTPFEGGKGEDYELVIGSNTFIPGFENQLIGATKGNEVDVNVTFPEDYNSEELKGKDAQFKVTVKEIKVKEYPEIDDEFAKDVSEFDTLIEYKDSIKIKLVEVAEKKAKSDTEYSILNLVVDDAGIEIPQVMIEDRIDYLLKDFGMRLKYQGFDMESYLKMTNLKAEDIRKDFADRALSDVKGRLVIEEICKVEAIEPTEEELEEAITKVAVQYGQKVEEFKQHLRDEDIEYIKNDSKYKKTIDFIVDNAKIN